MKKNRSNLYLYTFAGIFLSLILVGALAAPFLMRTIRTTYIDLQSDVNMRQAQGMTRILGNLLKAGEKKKDVIARFQAALAGTDTDRGYLCMINEKTVNFLCHPNKNVVGKPVRAFGIRFTPRGQTLAGRWEQALKQGRASSGILTMPGGRREIVYSLTVPGTRWRIFSHENTRRVESEIAAFQTAFVIGFIALGFVVAFPASFAARRVSRRYERVIEKEQARSEDLLLNILPATIARRLKESRGVIADRFENVSVLFADMVNFTPLAASVTPEELVALLNDVFSEFDTISKQYGLEKIKTIGDAYLLAGGLPERREDHLAAMIEAAFAMQEVIQKRFAGRENEVRIRIGLHAGAAVAGVIGSYKFSYDLWGETVNIAARLESTSLPGEIHCSEAVFQAMQGRYMFEPRGKVSLKGVGEMETYLIRKG